MDFSSLNPITSNALNLAARANNVQTVQRLLKKMNPNCIDNRGWTCLHEAAANDSYDSLILILKHRDCRPLAETHEGHTALYIACRLNASTKTIKALLDSVEDIANYGSTESVTPLHVASAQGRLDVMQLLIEYGAMLNVQDFDGDTPMHDAALGSQHEAITILLHAGAEAEIRNDPDYTPFHLACCKGCFQIIQYLFPFVTDINQCTINGDTPFMLAVQSGNDDIIHFLLKNGADPHRKNVFDELAINMALTRGYSSIFRILLHTMDKDKINKDIIMYACKPHFFKFEILEDLLSHDLGPEFFDYLETFHVTLEQIGDVRPEYMTSAPLNSYLSICEYIYNHNPDKFRDFFYLILMRGVSVNAVDVNECPPLVYVHYCPHSTSFAEVFNIFIENNCDIDHSTVPYPKSRNPHIPDAFLASLTSDPSTLPIMMPYSLCCEPEYILQFSYDLEILGRIPPQVQTQLLRMIDVSLEVVTPESRMRYVPPLKHLCRLSVRGVLREIGVGSTRRFLDIINQLKLPVIMANYLRYL